MASCLSPWLSQTTSSTLQMGTHLVASPASKQFAWNHHEIPFVRSFRQSKRADLVASSTDLAVSSTSFPSFLPPEVENLREPAAREMAMRIQRLPVHTRFCSKPIMTSCVIPQMERKDVPPLLLLHGFDSSCLEWRRIYPLLEGAGMEVWAVDILGWGFSASEEKVLSFGVTAKREHLYEFWKRHVKKPIVLVGASLGGAVAIDFAVAYPDVVSKLVLIDSQGYSEGVGNLASLPKSVAYAGVTFLKSVPLRLYANYLIFVRYSFRELVDSMHVGRLHCLMPGWEDAMVDFMLSGGYNVGNQISQVGQETLLIWGDEDKILPKDFTKKFMEDLCIATLKVLENCGHIPHVEKPAEVAAVLLEFVENASNKVCKT